MVLFFLLIYTFSYLDDKRMYKGQRGWWYRASSRWSEMLPTESQQLYSHWPMSPPTVPVECGAWNCSPAGIIVAWEVMPRRSDLQSQLSDLSLCQYSQVLHLFILGPSLKNWLFISTQGLLLWALPPTPNYAPHF